jgi:aminopeptidase N
MTGLGRRRRVRVLLAVCVAVPTLLSGCASTGPGLVAGRSSRTGSTSTSPDTSSPDTSSPDTSSPDTSSPDTSSPDASGPDASGGETSVPSTELPGTAGTSGLGDVLYPDLGNPGIDVQHYDVTLHFDRATGTIDATAALHIAATEHLDRFTLDAVGLDVASVTVDGLDAEFATDDPELRITPPAPLSTGEMFDVVVTYSAEANGGTISAGVSAGWFETDNGSFVLNEPDGARTWLPSNDHPSDKATYHFTITVPAHVSAVANGALVSHDTTSAGEVWVWDEPDPMTTYVIQLLTGPLDIVTGTAPNGVAMTSALQAGDQSLMQPYLDSTAAQLDFFDDWFGPYPFTSYGVAMTDGYIGGAMEEQGRSLFSRSDFESGETDANTELLLSHELAHQWFGDGVSPADWSDIWLNESFATYGQWMWLEHQGYGTVDDYANESLAQRRGSREATGKPTLAGLFGFEVYEGGAVVLQALRKTVGDEVFFATLRSWVQDNLGTSRTSRDFIELASKQAGRDLTALFDTWLYSADVPATYPS